MGKRAEYAWGRKGGDNWCRRKKETYKFFQSRTFFSTPSHGNKPFLDRRKKVVEYVFLFFLSFSLACLLAPSPVENDRKWLRLIDIDWTSISRRKLRDNRFALNIKVHLQPDLTLRQVQTAHYLHDYIIDDIFSFLLLLCEARKTFLQPH